MPGILSIFDFDDTLVTSTAKVRVTHKDGSSSEMDSGEYALYRAKPGDEFDYGDFEKYPPGAEPIGTTFRALSDAISQSGAGNVVILTARSADKPVRKYLSDQGISGVEIQAIGSSNPMDKARYVMSRLKDGDYDAVHVYEDNAQNIRAIEKVVTKAGVKFNSTRVMAEALEVTRYLVRQQLIQEAAMDRVKDWVKEFPDKAKEFFQNLKQEAEETAAVGAQIARVFHGHEITATEFEFVKNQIADIGKGTVVGAAAVAPGGSLLVPFLMKAADKLGVDLVPSAFKDEENLAKEDLKEVVRLINEDPIGFVHDLAASDKFGDDFFGGRVNKEAGREIKRAYANNADHQFLSSLNTVHWTTTYALKGLAGKGKDELSATMSLPGDEFVPAAGLEVGLWIKGRITLATNDQDMMYSGFHGDYDAPHEGSEEEVAHRDKSSGRNKRPSVSKDFSKYGQLKRGTEFGEKMARNMAYILDQSTFHQAAATWGGNVNEALVDNWNPHAIVIDERHSKSVEDMSDHSFEEIMALSAGTTKQIFSLANELGIPIVNLSRDELWSPEQGPIKEIRVYVRKLILSEKNVAKSQLNSDLFGEIGDFMETRHYDDVMDSVFKRIAPNLVRHVMEKEINEDVTEFLDGAMEGRFERRSGRFSYEDPSPQDVGHPADSADYALGYTWGWENADTWVGNELPKQARKEAIESQIQEFEDKISEQMVIAALEAANDKVNPIKLLGKATEAIRSAVQEDGMMGGLKKGLPIAMGIIVGEALDNFIIPMAVFSLTGYPIPPLPIGVGEIINPIVISMVGADTETEELADELGWYESEYGETSSLPPKAANELHEYIRSLIIEKELRGQKDKRVMYHIGKRPASPKPAERWGAKGKDGWSRDWIDGPVKSGVFVTENPTDVAQYHGVSGNVYTYKIPEWVIEKAGGKHRFDRAGEILISQEIWEEAGDEIEFLGKKMDQKDLWSTVDSSYYSAKERKGVRGAHKHDDGASSIEGLRATSHPEAAIKMMSPKEIQKTLEKLAVKYEVKPDEIIKHPGDRKGLRIPHWDFGPDEKDKQLLDLLTKHMKESVVREYVRGLLIELNVKDEQHEEEQEHSELDKILELFNNSSAHQAIELANMVGLGDTKEVKSMTAVHRLVKDWVELADKHIEGEQDAYELMENLKIIQKAAHGLQHSPEVKEVTVTPWLRGRKPGEGRSMPHGARPDWYHDIDLAETFYSQFQNNKYNHQEYGEKLRELEELEQYPNWLALKEWAGVP